MSTDQKQNGREVKAFCVTCGMIDFDGNKINNDPLYLFIHLLAGHVIIEKEVKMNEDVKRPNEESDIPPTGPQGQEKPTPKKTINHMIEALRKETEEWPKVLEEMNDQVNNPSHYIFDNFELIDFREKLMLPFHLDAALCYIVRHRHVGGLKDLKKAQWYIDKYIKMIELEKFRMAEQLKRLDQPERRNGGYKDRREVDVLNGVL
jgi:hypothetical protein